MKHVLEAWFCNVLLGNWLVLQFMQVYNMLGAMPQRLMVMFCLRQHWPYRQIFSSPFLCMTRSHSRLPTWLSLGDWSDWSGYLSTQPNSTVCFLSRLCPLIFKHKDTYIQCVSIDLPNPLYWCVRPWIQSQPNKDGLLTENHGIV